MRALQAEHRGATMCRELGVSTSGYNAWLRPGASARRQEDVVPTETICAIHEHSRVSYGARRVHAELAARGVTASGWPG